MNTRFPLRFDVDHPALPGHFPGNPIVPGVMLLAGVLDAIDALGALRDGSSPEVACANAGGEAGGAPPDNPGCRIRSLKFHSPALPGQRLDIALTQGGNGTVGFLITEAERRIASGTIETAR